MNMQIVAPHPTSDLSRGCEVAARAESPDLRAFYENWDRARNGRPMPSRRELSLVPIKNLLRHIHLYDVVDTGHDFRTRVIGTGVFLGRDPDTTGKLLSEHPDAVVRSRVGQALREVVNTSNPVRVKRIRPGEDRFHITHVESVYLPLGTADKAEQIVAMTIYTHGIQQADFALLNSRIAPAFKHDIFVWLFRLWKSGRRIVLNLMKPMVKRASTPG